MGLCCALLALCPIVCRSSEGVVSKGDGWGCAEPALSHLVNDAIPCKSGVVDDDVNLAVAELGGFLDQIVDIIAVEDIADDGKGTAGFRRVNGVGDSVGLFWLFVSY